MGRKRLKPLGCCCKIVVVTYIFVIVFWWYLCGPHWVKPLHARPPTCTIKENLQFIEELCYNFTHGNVAGTLCQSLCTRNNDNITFLECLSHKSGKVVILSKLNGLTMILKAVGIRESTIHKSKSETYSGLAEAMTSSGHKFPLSVVRRILSECDKNTDGLFTKEEATYCWHMYDDKDIRILFSLHDNPAIPALYGTCGNMMAIEYASNEPMIQAPMTMEYRSWKLRAQMGVALIELAENLEDTKYGTLHLCDSCRANIGFIHDNNSLIAKTIDNDMSVFKKIPKWRTAKGYLQSSDKCTSDFDCNLLKCRSTCNLETGKCTGVVLNSNLDIVCSRFLLAPDILKWGLLTHDVPIHVRQQLSSLLHKCTHPLDPLSNHLPMDIAKQLKELLNASYNS